MKAQTPSQQPAPRRVSLRLAVLAFVLLMAQPSHWMACCLAAFSGAHATPSASHGHAAQKSSAPDDGMPWNVAHEVADAEADAHASPKPAARSDVFVITPHCVRTTHHHHPLCCAGCGLSALTQKTARHGADTHLLVTFGVPAMPVFRLDVLEGRCTRAGPTDAPLFSAHIESALLGRAPPLSA